MVIKYMMNVQKTLLYAKGNPQKRKKWTCKMNQEIKDRQLVHRNECKLERKIIKEKQGQFVL